MFVHTRRLVDQLYECTLVLAVLEGLGIRKCGGVYKLSEQVLVVQSIASECSIMFYSGSKRC